MVLKADGIAIFRFDARLFFANAARFKQLVIHAFIFFLRVLLFFTSYFFRLFVVDERQNLLRTRLLVFQFTDLSLETRENTSSRAVVVVETFLVLTVFVCLSVSSLDVSLCPCDSLYVSTSLVIFVFIIPSRNRLDRCINAAFHAVVSGNFARTIYTSLSLTF